MEFQLHTKEIKFDNIRYTTVFEIFIGLRTQAPDTNLHQVTIITFNDYFRRICIKLPITTVMKVQTFFY